MKPKQGKGSRNSNHHWFLCINCRQPVTQEAYGTEHRNHCPGCLWSKHVDDAPGDRSADCDGAMEPVAVWVRQRGEWAIIHRCRRCGALHSNRIAGDDNELVLTSLAVRPLSQPSFPLDRLAVVDIRRREPESVDKAAVDVDIADLR